MHYFFVEGARLASGQVVELAPGDANHARRVLRLRAGSPVAVADGRGAVFLGAIASTGPAAVRVRLGEPLPAAESPLEVTLLQCLLKGDKMDLVIRQAVELGAARIIPVIAERSVPRRSDGDAAGRLPRWRAIARAAAAQCRRAVLPAVEPLQDFAQALAGAGDQPLLAPWEEEKMSGLSELFGQLFPAHGAVSVLIGPEGGFSEPEAGALAAAGARLVHLGPRILRAETAAAVTLALVQAAWGDLGGEVAR
jgi:16S rRNA (uracil1498-N3)-methyltransferase